MKIASHAASGKFVPVADPAVMTAAIAKGLNTGGRVAAIDFTPPPGSRAPTPADRGRDGTHGVRPEEMEAEFKAAGFAVAASEVGTRWFMLTFERPPG